MKVQNQLLMILILAGSCCFISCKKDKAGNKNNLVVSPPEQGPESGIYIPARLSSGKSNMIFSYTKTGALTKIDYEHGDSTILKFNTTSKPVEFRCYKSGILTSATVYSRNANGWIIKAQAYTVSGKDQTQAGFYTISYDSNGQITAVVYYDSNNRLVETQQYNYSPEGNLTGQKSAVLTANYSYDLNNGLFKQAGYAWVFALERENSLFLSVVNNIQQCNYTEKSQSNQQLNYVYNKAGYPTKITATALGLTATTNVIYQ